LGFDEQGREMLSYVEGEGGLIPLRPETVTDEALVGQAKLIRHFHDASASFQPGGADWDLLLADPSGISEIICHNDLSVTNTVYRDGHPVALVDWDFAAPGSRLWDLAYAVWWLVPLHRPEFMRSIGWPEVDQPRRLGAFCDAYGLRDERWQLLDVLRDRQVRNQSQLRQWLRDGIIPPFDENDPGVECGQTEHVLAMRQLLDSGLGRR
jgi:hypothetical protein